MTGLDQNWVQTFSGRKFWPLTPRADDVSISDIAHALARLCRFNGHSAVFYSVAQHSVLVSRLVPPEAALWGLLHDAAEAYVTDLPRPLKRAIPGYADIEARVLHTIATCYDLVWPMPADVKRADEQMLATEAEQLMAPLAAGWCLSEPPIPMTIQPWSPALATASFLARYGELTGERL